jgi:hypothetical protein
MKQENKSTKPKSTKKATSKTTTTTNSKTKTKEKNTYEISFVNKLRNELIEETKPVFSTVITLYSGSITEIEKTDLYYELRRAFFEGIGNYSSSKDVLEYIVDILLHKAKLFYMSIYKTPLEITFSSSDLLNTISDNDKVKLKKDILAYFTAYKKRWYPPKKYEYVKSFYGIDYTNDEWGNLQDRYNRTNNKIEKIKEGMEESVKRFCNEFIAYFSLTKYLLPKLCENFYAKIRDYAGYKDFYEYFLSEFAKIANIKISKEEIEKFSQFSSLNVPEIKEKIKEYKKAINLNKAIQDTMVKGTEPYIIDTISKKFIKDMNTKGFDVNEAVSLAMTTVLPKLKKYNASGNSQMNTYIAKDIFHAILEYVNSLKGLTQYNAKFYKSIMHMKSVISEEKCIDENQVSVNDIASALGMQPSTVINNLNQYDRITNVTPLEIQHDPALAMLNPINRIASKELPVHETLEWKEVNNSIEEAVKRNGISDIEWQAFVLSSEKSAYKGTPFKRTIKMLATDLEKMFNLESGSISEAKFKGMVFKVRKLLSEDEELKAIVGAYSESPIEYEEEITFLSVPDEDIDLNNL